MKKSYKDSHSAYYHCNAGKRKKYSSQWCTEFCEAALVQAVIDTHSCVVTSVPAFSANSSYVCQHIVVVAENERSDKPCTS